MGSARTPRNKVTGNQQSLGFRFSAPRREGEIIQKTPAGFRQPAQWDQLWGQETILLATPEGWEPIDKIESKETRKRITVMDPYTKRPVFDPETRRPKRKEVPWNEVTKGVVWWRGERLDGISLASLRIPEKGERGLRHG